MVPLVADLLVQTELGELFLVRLDLFQPFKQLGFRRSDPSLAVDNLPANKGEHEDDGCSVSKDAGQGRAR